MGKDICVRVSNSRTFKWKLEVQFDDETTLAVVTQGIGGGESAEKTLICNEAQIPWCFSWTFFRQPS